MRYYYTVNKAGISFTFLVCCCCRCRCLCRHRCGRGYRLFDYYYFLFKSSVVAGTQFVGSIAFIILRV